MSDIVAPTDAEVRNAAICLLAAEACLGDSMQPLPALEFATRLANAVDTDPVWANGRHEGDCTQVAMSCARCQLEEAEAAARKMWDAA